MTDVNLSSVLGGGAATGGGYDATAYQMIKTAVSEAAITAGGELADRREVFDQLVFNLTDDGVVIASKTATSAFNDADDALTIASNVPLRDYINGVPYLSALGLASSELSAYFKTGGGALDTFSYDSKSKSVSAETANPSGVFFKPDGGKLYVCSYNPDEVFQYTLSTPWDVSTATYDSVSLSVTSQESLPRDLFFSQDGTKLYVLGTGSQTVHQYTMSTPWDISTASYDSVSFTLTGEPQPQSMYIAPNGLLLFVVGSSGDAVRQYTLDTAWDISSAVYAEKSFSVASQSSNPLGIWISAGGDKLYIAGGDVFQYSLATPYDISTASYDSIYLNPADTNPEGIFFNSSGNRLYVVGSATDYVYQYSGTPLTSSQLFAPV